MEWFLLKKYTQNESIILPQLIFSPLLLQQFARRIYSSRQQIQFRVVEFLPFCLEDVIPGTFSKIITPRTAGKLLKKW